MGFVWVTRNQQGDPAPFYTDWAMGPFGLVRSYQWPIAPISAPAGSEFQWYDHGTTHQHQQQQQQGQRPMKMTSASAVAGRDSRRRYGVITQSAHWYSRT
uniref:ARAD1D12958p n=1 Tax=Blastobotrys adeninivorans TaxID=409370 RepID=A0A060TE59_BLAAD